MVLQRREAAVWIESPQGYKREGKDLSANRERGESGSKMEED